MSQFGLGDLLAVLVDADGDLDELAAVLVPHVDAVLAGVFGSDFVDDEAGELPAVEHDLGVLVGGDFLLVLEPCDLGSRLAPHSAGQAQGLDKVERQVKSEFIHRAILNMAGLSKYSNKTIIKAQFT